MNFLEVLVQQVCCGVLCLRLFIAALYRTNVVSFLGQTMMTPNMQGIIMAIGKARNVYDKSGPEAAFFKVLLYYLCL